MSLLNEAYRLQYACKKRKALVDIDKTIERARDAHENKRAKAKAYYRSNGLWSYHDILDTPIDTLAQRYADETVGEVVVQLTVPQLERLRDAFL